MDEKQYQELVAKLGEEAAKRLKQEADAITSTLTKLFEEKQKGYINQEKFDAVKSELQNELVEKFSKFETILKEQGDALAAMKLQPSSPVYKSLEDVIKDNAAQLKEIHKRGSGFIEVNLKAAGVGSIGNSVGAMASPPSNPYLPAVGGDMMMHDILHNPNFILNYVDMGRTALSRMPWINESGTEGGAALVAEGGTKPYYQPRFNVEISTAKKIAPLVGLTDEFEEDLPGLATQVRRMLFENVMRTFVDTIQAAVIAAATGYTLTSLNGQIASADWYGALAAIQTQVSLANYTPNVKAISPVTGTILKTTKGSDGHYIAPAFISGLIEANKVAAGKALVGDLKQYKVDIYKDYTLKMGFVNDDFAKNQFSIVGEIRYHDYISANRKTGIVYADLETIKTAINKA